MAQTPTHEAAGTNSPAQSDSPRDLAVVAAKGFCMGAADVVPGVSGGTMAFILGIYQRLIDAIRAFDLTALGQVTRLDLRGAAARVDLIFLIALGLGLASALVFFTRVVPLPKLIRTDPELIYGLFFGLIAASIVVLLRGLGRVSGKDWISLGAGIVVGGTIISLVPTETPETSWFVFLASALAICAMILPGISGSFILLILQKYAYIFDAIGRFDFSIIIPFALGAATGLMAFSRVLSWLLSHYYRVTLVVIIGILLSSLWKIWPFQDRLYVTVRGKERLMSTEPLWPAALDATVLASLGLAAVGFIAVIAIERLARRSPDAAP
ncbi:MAG: DUF368 domain-containing protein [Pseudomonadota bacterium]